MFSKKHLMTALAAMTVASTQVHASIVTWGVNASFGSGSVSGTMTFDDTSVQGFFDGYNDPFDTHVLGNFTLSSSSLGWLNQTFNGVTVQPYYYPNMGDGPHADYVFSANGVDLYLSDFAYAQVNYVNGGFERGSWSFDRDGNAVPVPGTLPLLGLGLAAMIYFGKTRRM